MNTSVKQTYKNKDPLELEKQFRIQMQREMILQKLKETGFRITKQRIAVIDIILENDCSSCKEIIYKAAKINKDIGAATIYRTLNMLEEIGAINRRNLYTLSYPEQVSSEGGVLITLQNGTEYRLNEAEWDQVLRMGMQACGYHDVEKIISITHFNASDI